MRARRLFLVGFAAALLTAFGCSSNVDDPVPSFACAGGTAAENTVAMVCGGGNDTTQQVDVVIGGQTGLELNALNFDVKYDGSSLQLVSVDTTAASQLFPGALPATVLNDVAGQPGYKELVVGIEMTGDQLAPVDAGEHVVLTLTFQRTAGMTFTNPLSFKNTKAIPVSANTAFDSSLSLSYLYR